MRRLAIVAILLAGIVPAAAQLTGNVPFLADALSTTVKTVKSSGGALAWYACSNPNAAIAFVQVFDTTGAVTLGTTVPKVSLPVQAQAVTVLHLGNATGNGVAMLAGIKIAATTTPKGLTAPAVALDCSFGFQ